MKQGHPRRGHCIVCEIEGCGERDFVCVECGDDSCITLYCSRCRTRERKPPEAIELLRRYTGIDAQRITGVIIKLSNCIDCLVPGETTITTVYTLRTPRN